jgi:CheY-like chemotaxis protein
MKLLIIAGPYEADRIRKAALSAGFETVAVEPGESLSGWITASRPELIIMAPQIVHVDPALALAKVRAVPRGRVPIFLVGDAADEARLRDLADGFFVRPIAPELLLERARAILTPPVGEPRRRKNSSLDMERTEMGIGPTGDLLQATSGPAGAPAPVAVTRPPKSGPHGPHSARPAGGTLKPLVAAALGGAAVLPVRGPSDTNALLAELGAGIDALLDAELEAALADAPKAAKPNATPTRPPQVARVAKADFAGETTKKVDPAVEPAVEPVVELAVEPAVEPGLLSVVAKTADDGRARLLARYAPVENGDYFAVLDVERDASTAELRRAHEKLIQETASEALDPGVASELAGKIEAIRTVVDEALRVLSDDNLRPRYASRMPK